MVRTLKAFNMFYLICAVLCTLFIVQCFVLSQNNWIRFINKYEVAEGQVSNQFLNDMQAKYRLN